MSNNKKKPTEMPKPKQLNLKGLLPEGFDEKDFAITGGLRPIVSPELMMDNPVVGWIVTRQEMPDRDDGTAWSAFLVQLTGPCKAVDRGENEIIEVPAGSEVIIPISGALRNNRELQIAALDPARVYLGIFSVSGQVNVGKPSPMWAFDVLLHKRTIPREGAFALHNRAAAPTLNGAATPRALPSGEEDVAF